MYRFCLLFAVLAMLVSVAPARAGGGGGGGHLVANSESSAAKRGHGSPTSIVPAGLAGAPLLTAWWREPLAKSVDDPTNPFVTGGCRPVARGCRIEFGHERGQAGLVQIEVCN